ncbi:hypothetical protein SAMN02745111_00702 [Eubacterium uniforme]|uniref:Uncharacterized protein n=1 Tax=Eubacterium uniforme TaxID=39495 RepID=A0A1T4VCW0_9FIRM|nr:hypothetical protein [Eubacterium uniforme]SKA62794.1 hypothetical protein SAMN02745111_00702 [Eubacterium uniforme]
MSVVEKFKNEYFNEYFREKDNTPYLRLFDSKIFIISFNSL